MKKILILFLLILSFTYSVEVETRAVIQSIDRTTLSSQIAGKIIGLYKENGDYFKKGQTLIKIDCDVYKAERKKIKNKMKLAKLKLAKNKQLIKYNSIGQFEIDTSRIEYEGVKIEYEIASINVNRCLIKAPFNGRIVQKKVNRFQSIKPQQELLEIVNSDNLEAKLVVPATWLNWLQPGKELKIFVDEVSVEISAKVKQVDSVVDPKSQTISVRASLEKNKKLIPGMSGTAKFHMLDIDNKTGDKNE